MTEPTINQPQQPLPSLPSGLVCALCHWFEGPETTPAITVIHGYALCVKHVSYLGAAGAKRLSWEAAIDLYYADLSKKGA